MSGRKLQEKSLNGKEEKHLKKFVTQPDKVIVAKRTG